MSKRVLLNRVAWINKALEDIQSLPLENYIVFSENKRTLRAAETYLRRALEGLLDLGQYILTNGFGVNVAEYEEVAQKLDENNVLTKEEVALLKAVAKQCRRLVHARHEVSDEELYKMCKEGLNGFICLKEAYSVWIHAYLRKIEQG
ncbi:MAG: DUF86 domain-containing protein [Candidatus Desulfofervidaceae bacterium]|nr:DUF86 domain-containing protein [Candidatus Desulfofervidaceae bacterium]